VVSTLEPTAREFVPGRGRRSNLRVLVNRHAPAPSENLDDFIERLRCDTFDQYAVVREAQRERDLSPELRLRMLGEAAATARYIADTIDRRRAAMVFDLEQCDPFGVPI
jgi:hypothetical protein